MRDIKFRAYSTVTGDFDYVSMAQLLTSDNSKISSKMIKDDLSIMQFTGLQDMNGVDIYEGDIVSILFTDWVSQPNDEERSLDEYLESLEKVFPICFYKGAFQISGKGYYGNDIGYDDIECGKHGYIKVIGNIHKNPGLLS